MVICGGAQRINSLLQGPAASEIHAATHGIQSGLPSVPKRCQFAMGPCEKVLQRYEIPSDLALKLTTGAGTLTAMLSSVRRKRLILLLSLKASR